MTRYYVETVSSHSPHILDEESDQQIIQKAKNLFGEELLCIYEEMSAGDIREVYFTGE